MKEPIQGVPPRLTGKECRDPVSSVRREEKSEVTSGRHFISHHAGWGQNFRCQDMAYHGLPRKAGPQETESPTSEEMSMLQRQLRSCNELIFQVPHSDPNIYQN